MFFLVNLRTYTMVVLITDESDDLASLGKWRNTSHPSRENPFLNLYGWMRITSELVYNFRRAMQYRINFTFTISLSHDVDLAMLFASVKNSALAIFYRKITQDQILAYFLTY